jgi:drug/metabolite transporter (DMT)-like permease
MDKKPYLALFISIVSVSFAAIFIKTISENVSSLGIAFYRLFFTTLLLSPIIIFHKKTREEIKNIPKKTLFLMILIGIILASHFAFWITSLDYTSIASSVILVTIHPVFVAPLAFFLFKEKISIINMIGISFSLSGVVVLVFGNYVLEENTIGGNLLAILGGIAAGLYILGGRKVRKKVSVAAYALIVYTTSTIVLLGICIITRIQLMNYKLIDYEIILLMAAISGILGHTLYNWTLKHIRASVVSVALLGEPLGSTLLAFILPWINQTPTNFTIIGGIFILLGIYLTASKHKIFW